MLDVYIVCVCASKPKNHRNRIIHQESKEREREPERKTIRLYNSLGQ